MMIEKFDVCIIGASIAGNYLSYLLANTDLNVAVIEEHTEIGRPLQCAGIISQKLAKLIELPSEIVLNRVQTARIVSPSGKFIDLSGEERPFIVDRIALDQLFYNKAKKSENITFFLGEKFRNFHYRTRNGIKRVVLETTKRKLSTSLLIGCDGPFSSVGNQLGIKNRNIYATQMRMHVKFAEDKALMYFDPRWKELFGWVVPEDNGICRVGLASAENPAQDYKFFLKALNLRSNKKIDAQGGAIPYGLMNECAFDHVILLGDSAGQVKATTGGGIVMLLTAAKIARNCIINAFQKHDFSKKFLKNHYQQLCKTTIGRELKMHFLIRLIFEHFDVGDYDTFFQIIKTTKIEDIISLYGDMDFPRQLVIKLLGNIHVIRFLIRFWRKNPLFLFKILKVLKN
ncbi:MAG: geranylgeranyl reductase family protein [Promethearchaeia archaeon]